MSNKTKKKIHRFVCKIIFIRFDYFQNWLMERNQERHNIQIQINLTWFYLTCSKKFNLVAQSIQKHSFISKKSHYLNSHKKFKITQGIWVIK